jgi:hypothetical protein
VEEEFSEVRGSKHLLKRNDKHSTLAWLNLFGIETLRLSSVRCTVMYQGVTTRNSAIT